MEENSEKSNELLDDDNQVFEIENETESLFGIENDDLETESELVLDIEDKEDQMIEFESNGHDLTIQNNHPPPVTGMEFESYEEAYKHYNTYAKELGFAIRVKSSWTKRNSKEKRGAVLCCNCEGFKTLKEASTRRKETRTGCLAMIRLRLIESNKWRIDEVKLEHNHLFDPERAQNSKSHKQINIEKKRKFESNIDVEVRTIKLYQNSNFEKDTNIEKDFTKSKKLNLKKGDAKIINDYFTRVQLINPSFFYVMDFTEDGFLRNVFWIDSRARSSFGYFGDVVAIDTTCLTNNYEIPLVVFVGVNHHGQTISLGYGLLVDQSQQTYNWLLRVWLTCMAGRPPQTLITDMNTNLQNSILEIFPRTHHRYYLPIVIETILENFGNVNSDYDVFRAVISNVVYNSIKVEEFEVAWDDMIQRFAFRENETIQKIFEERERWAPVYSKDTFFAGMLTLTLTFQPESTPIIPFFQGYVHQKTTLKEFFEMHDLVSQNKIQKEAFDDRESTESIPKLLTNSIYEKHLSKIYTKDVFTLFQYEVQMMSTCFNITQVNTNGSIITYLITEQESNGNVIKNFEVMYDKIGVEVRCICSCFNFKGFLCRHALSVLNHNGINEIPNQYILSRWRKDFKRVYIPGHGSGNNVDISNPVQWFVHLNKRALQVVEEGMSSQERYMVAWQAFKESLNKVRLVVDKNGQN